LLRPDFLGGEVWGQTFTSKAGGTWTDNLYHLNSPSGCLNGTSTSPKPLPKAQAEGYKKNKKYLTK